MATVEGMKKQIQKSSGTKTLKDWVVDYKSEIERALPSVITQERFSRMVMSALSKTPKLKDCTPNSFLGAMLDAAQLGLEPNTTLGQAYLIPYGKVCQFQIGYRGMIDLANRSGEIKNIESHIVYEKDDFDFEYGLESRLKHKPYMHADKGEPVWVYAIYRLVNGGYGFEVMSYEDVIAHGRQYSKTFSNGPWQTNPEEMAKKTLLKKVLKYAPMRSDFVRALAHDEQVLQLEEDGDIIPLPMEEAPEDAIEIDPKTGEIAQEEMEV